MILMLRLFCVLPAPMRSMKIRHYRVRAGTGESEKQEMPAARLLVIEADEDKPGTGALLYRFDSKGECVGDTWHDSVAAAKGYANVEYETTAQTWRDMPAGVDVDRFVTADFNAPANGIG